MGAAAKVAPEQIIPTVVDQRFPTGQVVLLEPDAPVDPIPFEGLPAAPGVEADVTGWQPGAMTVTLSSPAPAGSYLLVAENHYPDWTAAVNGDSRAVLRGNGALLTVALDEGDQSVTLRFESSDYLLGKWISVISVGLAGLAVAGPVVRRRRGV